ncbi:hypothetical protein V1521DRAFT_442787 [Lipomyces starkeyi]
MPNPDLLNEIRSFSCRLASCRSCFFSRFLSVVVVSFFSGFSRLRLFFLSRVPLGSVVSLPFGLLCVLSFRGCHSLVVACLMHRGLSHRPVSCSLARVPNISMASTRVFENNVDTFMSRIPAIIAQHFVVTISN